MNKEQNTIEGMKECISKSTVAREKNKTFRIECKSNIQIFKIHVDGCLIKGTQIRCDYAFIIPDTGTYYFVELKSEDINHAFNQIVETINYFKKTNRIDKECIEGYIVSSSVPAAANLKFQGLVAKFKKIHGKSLVKHTNLGIKYLK